MASIQKTSRGYRAQLKIQGVRQSKLFSTKREAAIWAANREREIREDLNATPGQKHSLREALRRYAKEISPTKKGARWEKVRLTGFERSNLPLDAPVAQVTNADIALFRDQRLRSVSGASVAREMTLLSSVFQIAKLEWGWVDKNPCREVRKPPQPAHRDRVITAHEVKEMLRSLKYRPGQPVRSVSQAVGAAMVVALRTGMRAGELCNLRWTDVKDGYARLPVTKNGTTRHVPLSAKAAKLINSLRDWDDELVFGIKTATLDALFRKHRLKAGLEGFTFHDTRHTAATMIAKKVDVLTLCKIFGWKDTSFALVYFNPSAKSIASLL